METSWRELHIHKTLHSKYWPQNIFALSFLFFCLSLHMANCADPLYHFCFSQENYTANSPYATNLKWLLNLLSTKVPPTGFRLSSTGESQNKINGLALCRGNVSSTNCKTCVVDAGKELRSRCPYKEGAIIWYDNCLLKYSNIDFFGEIDNKNKFYMWNVQDVDNPTSFNPKVKDLLSKLSNKAYDIPKLYAAGELELGLSQTLYGLAQCTRDLSGDDCKKCLDGVIMNFPTVAMENEVVELWAGVVMLDMNFTPLWMEPRLP